MDGITAGVVGGVVGFLGSSTLHIYFIGRKLSALEAKMSSMCQRLNRLEQMFEEDRKEIAKLNTRVTVLEEVEK